ncbi:hypothetical protein CEXT_731421 [Caerostris extrusa]|uniref:Uncharacterized protein n=1 Tax=Caerostris extrusa TaxID=172846 RepID=A0AAV4PCU5_CAEEX|nr:hypothetical protein CEXT_731421 [Caerostris extrusa]
MLLEEEIEERDEYKVSYKLCIRKQPTRRCRPDIPTPQTSWRLGGNPKRKEETRTTPCVPPRETRAAIVRASHPCSSNAGLGPTRPLLRHRPLRTSSQCPVVRAIMLRRQVNSYLLKQKKKEPT